MSNAPKDPKDIFLAALDIPDPAGRAMFVEKACDGDAVLRKRVENLLGAYGEPDGPLEKMAAALAPTQLGESIREQVGSSIGPYKLMEQIGEGGFGLVFVAEQQQPIRRKVALKIIKPGMDTRDVIARFEAERQALALMDHPNIARVLDAGTTESGRPYFVMELVRGIPITDYCDQTQLTPRERLELFVPVCNAIQHAHLKGIIHRDVKPSNVLITLHDDRPVVKVIDFGVAKALYQSLTERTIYTRFAQMIGTPLYMSPEQAKMSGLDIDTRSDIYSLGVLLYELLTGSTPFNKERLAKAAYDELLKIIREEEPPKPSVRLSQSTATLPSIAAQRKTEPAKLSKMFNGDLDWIAMKALEKDRTRRYETANAFAADVSRYLNDEPVEASPPSAGYRLRKFIRKHRVGLVTVSAFAGLLIAAAGISAALAIKARRAEAEAEENANAAKELAQSRADALEQLSEREKRLRLELSHSAILAASKQIDLDLAEAKTNPWSTVLRLARSNKVLSSIDIPRLDGQVAEDQRSVVQGLRTFAAAAILVLAQKDALFVPTNDLRESFADASKTETNPNGRNLVTLHEGAPQLWDVRTGTRIALLQRNNEKVVACGFSPNGKTIYSNDTESIVRFWAASDGSFLSTTGLPEPRILYPAAASLSELAQLADTLRPVHLANSTALVDSHRVTDLTQHGGGWGWTDNGSRADVVDVATGRFLARLDRPAHTMRNCQLSPDARWIIAVEDSAQVVIFSAADGRERGRLVLTPKGMTPPEWIRVWVSPNARRVMTRHRGTDSLKEFTQLWEADSWHRLSDAFIDHLGRDRVARFVTDDLIEVGSPDDGGDIGTAESLYRIGTPNSPTPPGAGDITAVLGGELLLYNETELIDGRTLKRLSPPAGRKFHPALKRLTKDGRFFFSGDSITDTVTEKQIPDVRFNGQRTKYWTGFGTIASEYGWRMLPAPQHLEIPPDLLDLWAQVAARGHLDGEGAFVKWDEQPWEKIRQELANEAMQWPILPFLKPLADDRLYWLRQEYASASDAYKPLVAKQLVDRANAVGDNVEVAHWVAVVANNLIDSLIAKPLLRADVEVLLQERLRQDTSLNGEIRAAALSKASKLAENATDLNNESWSIAARPNAAAEEYRRALRWAEAAVGYEPKNPLFVNTLGVLQYRNGLYRDAIATLLRSHKANQSSKTGPQPTDLAFLAMAHQALGRASEAQSLLRQLSDLLKEEKWKADGDANALFKEARQRLAKKP